jgi:hypothetical protein
MLIAAASATTLLAARVHAQAQAPESAQSPSPPAAALASAVPAASLDQLAWLRGCWAGKVEKFDFIEQWSAPRAGMMVGLNHMMVQDKQHAGPARTDSFGYLRLDARADGIYYVAVPSGKKEAAFKFTSTSEENGHTTYTFVNPGPEFPQQVIYVRGAEGWLYAQVAGKLGNEQKKVTYPMRRVDCATGALIAD